MDDLVHFLRARYREEQIEAEKQPDGEESMLDGWEIMATAEANYPGYEYLRVAKRRVVAEVDAKRRIIEDCEGIIVGWHHEESKEFARDVLRNLAEVYADHPDYRDDWRP